MEILAMFGLIFSVGTIIGFIVSYIILWSVVCEKSTDLKRLQDKFYGLEGDIADLKHPPK